MNTHTAPHAVLPAGTPPAARAMLRMLARLRHGHLTLQLPDGSQQFFGQHANMANRSAPEAMLALRNWNIGGAALRSGDIGVAESYIAGDWNTPNLSDLLKLFIANRREVDEAIYGSWLGQALYRLRHWFNRNTKSNSRKNIHAHYDLGNAFYAL